MKRIADLLICENPRGVTAKVEVGVVVAVDVAKVFAVVVVLVLPAF